MFFRATRVSSVQSVPTHTHVRRRPLALIGLAVAIVMPAGVGFAADLAVRPVARYAQVQITSEALQAATDLFARGEYQQAVEALAAIDPATLNDVDRATLESSLADAQAGVSGRQEAAAAFDRGEQALADGRYSDAAVQYQAVVDSPFADPGTRTKSVEQLGLAQANLAGSAAAPTAAAMAPTMSAKEYYNQAVAQYRSGDWIAARDSFNSAINSGYRAGLFQDSPQKYLARMDAKEAADRASTEAALASAAAPAVVAEPMAVEPVVVAEPMMVEPVVVAEPVAEPVVAPVVVAEPVVAAPVAVAEPVIVEAAPAVDTAALELAETARLEKIRSQQSAFESQQLLSQAQAARAAGRNNDALDLYTQAVQVDSTNAAAVAGRDEMLAVLGRQPVGQSLLDRSEAQIRTRRDAITYSFNENITKATAATAAGDYVGARTALDRARVAKDTDRNIFNAAELAEFDSRVASSQATLEKAEAVALNSQRVTQTTETARREEVRRADEQRQKQQTVSGLIEQARTYASEGRYDEALAVLDQITLLDPRNDYANGVRPFIEDKANFLEQRTHRENFNRQLTKVLNQAEEKKIPYNDILVYPSDWPDLSARRDQTVAAEVSGGVDDQVVQSQLDKVIPEIRFEAVGLADVIDWFRNVTGANIFVNWRSLENAGIDRTTPVTQRLRNVRFAKALETILNDVGGGTVELGYTVDEGVITIATGEVLAANVILRTYDIRDLLVSVPDFDNAPSFDLSAQSGDSGGDSGGNSGGGGGGGGGLFGGSESGGGGGGGGEGGEQVGQTRAELIAQITDLITQTVASDSWRINGGTVGALQELQGQLIVTQTPENHRKLMGLLEQLRETRAIQITIECRFLTVQRNFLEDVGVDMDFAFNINGSISDNLSVIPISQNSSSWTQNPSTQVPGSIGGTVDGAAFTASGTFLDDFAVNFLIRATQASQTSTTLTAPRITLFNGQRAYILVVVQRSYVSDLTPAVGQGAVAFDPEIDTVESGVALDVQATVSADRKYVTMTLQPQLSTLLNFFTFSFQETGGVTTDPDPDVPPPPDGGGTVIIGGDGAVSPTATIQQPEIQLTQLATTVNVPDGGTLLLGGQTLAGEIEKEAGVPILSKIPFAKRLFTNRSMAKDEQVLLILVKPTIIIQREQEQRQFPLLSSKVNGG